MQTTAFRMACLLAALVAPAGVSVVAAGSGASLEVKISFRDGAIRTARLQGVGCTQSICSRIVIKGEDSSHRLVSSSFDSLASIRAASDGGALFVLNDRTERRLSLVKDFRVLYLETQSGATEKLDLTSVKSVEFLRGDR